MDQLIDKLKREFENNPLQTIAIGALATTAVAKLIDAVANAKGRSTWKREVRRRERMGR